MLPSGFPDGSIGLLVSFLVSAVGRHHAFHDRATKPMLLRYLYAGNVAAAGIANYMDIFSTFFIFQILDQQFLFGIDQEA